MTANDFLTLLHKDILAGKYQPEIEHAENISDHEILIYPKTGPAFLFGYPIDVDENDLVTCHTCLNTCNEREGNYDMNLGGEFHCIGCRPDLVGTTTDA